MRPKKHSYDKYDFLTSRAKGVINDLDAFSGKQVYLDIENPKSGAFIEDSLKQLGAVVHDCLVDEVNLVITDRKGWIANNSGADNIRCQITSDTSSRQLNPKTFSEVNTLEGKEDLHTKSRGGEMLHRSKRQPVEDAIDPLDLASKNGIDILSLSDAQNCLHKLLEAEPTGLKLLKAPFIKLDFRCGNYQPCFKEFSENWPAIRIKGSGIPFIAPLTKSSRVNIQTADVEDKVAHLTLSESRIDFQKINRFKEESRSLTKRNTPKSVQKTQIFLSGSNENCCVISGNKLHTEAKPTVPSAKGITEVHTACNKCQFSGQTVSECLARLRLCEDLKYDAVLHFPPQHSCSGKFLTWLPRDIKESGRVHVALTSYDCDTPAGATIPSETKVFCLPQFHQLPQACSKNIFAVTGGTRAWISLDNSENPCELSSGFTEATLRCNFANTGETDVVIGSNDLLCESPTYSCAVTLDVWEIESTTNGKVLMQFELPDFAAQTSFKLKVTTNTTRQFCYSDTKFFHPVVDIGLLEKVVCHLLSSVILEQSSQCWIWKVSQKLLDSGETKLENKAKWTNFELFLPELLCLDPTLKKFFTQANDYFLDEGKSSYLSGWGYCTDLELNFKVKLYRHCVNTCHVDDPFKKVISHNNRFPVTRCESAFLVGGEKSNINKVKYDPKPVRSGSKREQLLEATQVESVQKHLKHNEHVMRDNFSRCKKECGKKSSNTKPMRKLHEITDSTIYGGVVSGFCQICNCNYKSLAEHIKEKCHVDFLAKSDNFIELDKTIHEISRSSIFGQRQVAEKQ